MSDKEQRRLLGTIGGVLAENSDHSSSEEEDYESEHNSSSDTEQDVSVLKACEKVTEAIRRCEYCPAKKKDRETCCVCHQ